MHSKADERNVLHQVDHEVAFITNFCQSHRTLTTAGKSRTVCGNESFFDKWPLWSSKSIIQTYQHHNNSMRIARSTGACWWLCTKPQPHRQDDVDTKKAPGCCLKTSERRKTSAPGILIRSSPESQSNRPQIRGNRPFASPYRRQTRPTLLQSSAARRSTSRAPSGSPCDKACRVQPELDQLPGSDDATVRPSFLQGF